MSDRSLSYLAAIDRIADLKRQLSATRAELAEAREAGFAEARDRIAHCVESMTGSRFVRPEAQNSLRTVIDCIRDMEPPARAALAPVTESASEGGLPEPPEPR